MNIYEFIERVEHPEGYGDYVPPETDEWQFGLLQELKVTAIEQQLDDEAFIANYVAQVA